MNKHILLGISGGIAAYKSCELVRLLKKQGHSVTVAMSRAATEFVSPLTFQALSGNPVLAETHSGENGGNGMAHINLTREADVFLIAPASGEQACGEIGVGRMPEAAELADLLPDLWTTKSLQGKKVLITAGATFEAIDPVRGITNLSSGQMGMALSRACRAAGAEVSLIYGQLQTGIPAGLAYTEQAVSAEAMYQAVMRQANTQDVFISVAAVADYKVKNSSAQKIKKDGSGTPPVIELTENPDILASVAKLPKPPFCVGFAAESENVVEYGRAKRIKKGIPMLVANDVATAMGKPVNRITIIDEAGETAFPETDKQQAAAQIVAALAAQLAK